MADPTRVLEEDPDQTAEPEHSTVDVAEADELLSLLGDEYTMDILTAIGDDALRAREIAERTGISRQTVYRRLNGLESAGLVEAELMIDASGHHCKEFRVVVDELEVTFEAGTAMASSAGTRPT